MANSTIGGIVKIRIKNVPKFEFRNGISELLEGCEVNLQIGEEDSSSYLHGQNQRLGNADHIEFSYQEIVDSIRTSRGADTARKFCSMYLNEYGLMSANNPINIKRSYVEIIY